MFRIEMFPAREGDCLILSYGSKDAPKRIMIDGGREATFDDIRPHLLALPKHQRRFELLIVTHVDRDHIEGILSLLADAGLGLSFADVWFNGFHHLNDGDFENFSPVQGERLSRELARRADAGKLGWNASFGEDYAKAAALAADGSLLEVDLGDGMILTLLSPTRSKMQALIPEWNKACAAAGLVAGEEPTPEPPPGYEFFGSIDIEALAADPFETDGSKPNGSSIAVLAQYGGKSALLAGDAHAEVLEDSINRLRPDEAPLALDLFKLPHHGSRKNLSRSLLESVRCKHYLVSTSGAYFKHPDPVAMSRLIKFGGPDIEIWFNYRSEETEIWESPTWQQDYRYEVHYPVSDSDGYQLVDLDG